MKIVEYLEKNQQIPYKILENSLRKNEFFHAYLLNGSIGTPLLEIAKFIAKSIFCEHANPFCCDKCNTCKRIDNGTYVDLIIVDGSKESIKKDDISTIISQFSNTANEKKGIKIYILNLVENMTLDATNSLLKFLEEPPANTYAILTTLNKFYILPTIISRCEVINFSLLDQKELINNAINLNVSKEDAELLSFFYNDETLIKESSLKEEYIEIKNSLLNFIKKFKNKDNAIFYLETYLLPLLKSKEDAKNFFDYLIIFFKESLKYKINKTTFLSSYIEYITSIINYIPALDKAILTLVEARNELNFNLLVNLLVIRAITEIFGE